MANFHPHLNVGALITGTASASLVAAGHVNLDIAIWLCFLGTLGGLLPDIDSDNSTSLDTIFNLFAFAIILIIMRYLTNAGFDDLSFIKVIAIPVLIYGFMKYVLRVIFERLTVHRGSCHSLLFLAFSGLMTTQLMTITTDHNDAVAWLSGGFVFLGGLVHLLLDEIYSVDLRNITIKRSFGSALKLIDLDSKLLALVMLFVCIGLGIINPALSETFEVLSDWSRFSLF